MYPNRINLKQNAQQLFEKIHKRDTERVNEVLTVGKVLLVYEMRRQVLPTAPSPTVTHFINLEALILPNPIRPSQQLPQLVLLFAQNLSLSVFFPPPTLQPKSC